MRNWIFLSCLVLSCGGLGVAAAGEVPLQIRPWVQLMQNEPAVRLRALQEIESGWDQYSPARAIETLRFLRPGTESVELIKLLQDRTGFQEAKNWFEWVQWLWRQAPQEDPLTLRLKSELHTPIDLRFRRYFLPDQDHEIRYDEILWGGVRQNGIPPLIRPAMLNAAEATYLADQDVVFGVVIKGKAFAYPKRILAWHEMFIDQLEGVPLAGVYCTLCGAVIIYETEYNGERHHLGTSGFLYRSNKLMFDEATHSLWSTLEGRPVVGPLVGQEIELKRRHVVTTTWGAWRLRRPDSKVLSLETGHRRDYSEGAAYRDYFASDRLMFPVPFQDQRLANKAEIIGMRLGEDKRAVALSVASLRKQPVFLGRHEEYHVLALTDTIGTHRVFSLKTPFFVDQWNGVDTLIEENGTRWTLEEDGLVADDGRRLPRLTTHRAFWFGWYAAFPETELFQ